MSVLRCLLVVASVVAASAQAELKLPPIFADHMVVQRDTPVPIWGRAAPNEKLVIALGERRCETAADASGAWRAEIPATPAGGPFKLTITASTSTLTLEDVLVGEVWFCGGQSNMEFKLPSALNGDKEAAEADFPQIRTFNVDKVIAPTPQEEAKGKWFVCSPANAKEFSAVAYFFAREIYASTKVPIGLIHASAGWTPAEAWMPRDALMAQPELRYIAERWDGIESTFESRTRQHARQMEVWKKAAEKAKAEGKPEPGKPAAPPDPKFLHRASGLYNGSVYPLTRYALRGVIFYQGETNEVRGMQYRRLFPALIQGWRKAWNKELPFFYVQLANVLPPDPEPSESEWAELRESQLLSLNMPHTGMAVAIDIGEANDVHPKNKQDVGKRLSLWAETKCTAKPSSSRARSISRSRSKARKYASRLTTPEAWPPKTARSSRALQSRAKTGVSTRLKR
ncbi:MAG TPA: sialate O-acetylesterase [Planctomycetota bacterium]|nr:sialate O-acetylesterase [Planctomycetota bacterium]